MKMLEIIGLQGAIADGSEETFDGQPMQRGTHLRWGFAPELGFPAGGFWLCRRRSEGRERVPGRDGHLRPPEEWQLLCRSSLDPERRRDDERRFRPPRWEELDSTGWEYLSAPFVLPITLEQWPARYPGAPNPASTPPDLIVERDIKECQRRLNGLMLDPEMTAAEMDQHLRDLRDTLHHLVRDHPGPPSQYDHALPQSVDGKSAPQLGIKIMQELLLLALNPHFARILGLYYVDEEATGEIPFDYFVLGCWGSLPSATRVVAPGVASGSALAKGKAQVGGLEIEVPNAPSAPTARLWRWLRDDGMGNYAPQADKTAPDDVRKAIDQSVVGVAPKDQPPALLAIDPQDPYTVTFADVCQLSLKRAVSTVGVQVVGKGVVDFFSNGTALGSKSFASSGLVTLYFDSPSPEDLPIDKILIRSEPEVASSFPLIFTKSIVRVGQIAMYLLGFNYIGSRWALLQSPGPMKPLQAPDQPFVRFRQREAVVIADGPRLEPRSFFEIRWAAQARTILQGHGPRDGIVPPPTQPIGFRAARKDTGGNGDPHLLRGLIAVVSQPTPPAPEPRVPKSSRMHLVTDADVPDPTGDYVYRVAAFDAFGALGYWSDESDPINVERVAAAPTLLRVVNFDNTAPAGGAATATGDAWKGGKLTLDLGWSASAAMSFPDAVTTRLYVRGADEPWQVFETLVTHDLSAPKFVPKKINVTIGPKITSPSGAAHVFIRTQPALTEQTENQPSGVLVLVGVLAGGERVIERYIARPTREASQGNAVVIRIPVSDVSRIVANQSLTIEAAYFIPGAMQRIDFAVPLSVHIDRALARGVVQARSSRSDPFDQNETVINPNTGEQRPEPDSVTGTFIGPQRLIPPAPPTPVPSTKHEYYDPADFYGRATRVLPFDTTVGAGVSGFALFRAPSQTLFLRDMQRRESNAADNANLLALVPGEKFDLGSWLGSIAQWLSAFNKRSATNLSNADALTDENARRSFVEHFYGGLMDSELRALADIDANRSGFARVEAPPIPVSDTIDGKGFERVLYKLAAVNAAGSSSQVTGAAGPYYTRIVMPPRPPTLTKIASNDTSITIEWMISQNPDIAAYLVYRAETREDLADLRDFGKDPVRPLPPSALAQLVYTHTQRPAMKFSGVPDRRIRALVADPRMFARDFDGSDRAEIPLPEETEQIFGVYRLSEFNAAGNPLNQPGAFNYWRPVAKGSTLAAAPRRVKGLRVGLGRGVPVVVVAQIAGANQLLGTLQSRRISFIDEAGSADAIAGTTPPQSASTTYYYAVVAVDIFGNRSAPSTIFSGQLT